jgi:hypothetical protein
MPHYPSNDPIDTTGEGLTCSAGDFIELVVEEFDFRTD